MHPRAHRRNPQVLYGTTPRVYGAPAMHGYGCARANEGLSETLGTVGAIALIGGLVVAGFLLTKRERDAKIEKDLAIAQAIREGKVSNLNLAQTEANVTGYGMNF